VWVIDLHSRAVVATVTGVGNDPYGLTILEDEDWNPAAAHRRKRADCRLPGPKCGKSHRQVMNGGVVCCGVSRFPPPPRFETPSPDVATPCRAFLWPPSIHRT